MAKYELVITYKQTVPRVRYVREIVEYGAHIPTLERLADEGHFD